MSKELTEDELYALSDEELEQRVVQERQEEDNTAEEESEPQEEEEATFSKQDEEDLDEETEQVEEEIQEDETPDVQTPETYKVRADGLDYDFTVEELLQLAPKAMNYTKKTQALSPYRTMISAMEENGVSPEDVNLFIDIKKGNKEALASLVKGTGMDIFDLNLEDESSYTPTQHGKSEQFLQLEDVISNISKDKEYSRTQEALTTVFDDTSKNIMFENPDMVNGLHIDIVDGTYDKIMPKARKLALLDGNKKPLLEYYVQVGQEELQQEQLSPKSKPKSKDNTDAKRSASLPKQSSKGKVTDFLSEEEEDEEYQKWYNNLRKDY